MSLSTTQYSQWTGSALEIEKALDRIGADREESGQYRIYPANTTPSLFGSEQDILVTREVLYFVRKIPMRLADLMIQATGRPTIFNRNQ
jgi:hypothetical protein